MHASCALLVITIVLIGPTAILCCSHGTKNCGTGCTPPLGYCVDDKCYDRKEKQVDCEPDYEHCSGVVCGLDEFCADGRTCRPNNCKERQRYMCPADTSPLRSVACINSTFTDCYLSQHFNCSIGPGTAQTSCTLKPEANSAGKPAAWRLSSQVLLLLLQTAFIAVLAAVGA